MAKLKGLFHVVNLFLTSLTLLILLSIYYTPSVISQQQDEQNDELMNSCITYIAEINGSRQLFIQGPNSNSPSHVFTGSDVHHYDPYWSPDGRWLAYAKTPNPNSTGARQIFRIQPNGSSNQQLTDDQTYKSSPVWSPDGNRIAYIVRHATTGNQLAVKTDIQVLDITTNRTFNIASSNFGITHLSATRGAENGDWLSYTDLNGPTVHVINWNGAAYVPDNTAEDRIFIPTINGSGAKSYFIGVDWIPNSYDYAVASYSGGYYITFSAPGYNLPNNVDAHSPAISDSGDFIAFISYRTPQPGYANLYLYHRSNHRIQPIRNAPMNMYEPSWTSSTPFGC